MKICMEDSLHLCEDCPQRWAAVVEMKSGDDVWVCFADEQSALAWTEYAENGGEIGSAEIEPHTVLLFRPKEGFKK